MKIHDMEGLRLPEKIGSQSGSAKPKGDFQEVMNQAITRNTADDVKKPSVNSVLVPEMLLNVQSARTVGSEAGADTSGQKVVRAVEGALEMAGHYAGKLADPAVKTEALEPLLAHLEERLHGLSVLQTEGTVDGALKKIISDLNISLTTEIAKFRRGDYS
jgi:hypothetical protein